MILTAAILAVGWCTPAAAYADPGTGAMLWQLAVAALAGVMFKVRSLKAWLQKRRSK